MNHMITKPWYKKWWVITIGVVLALSIIGNLTDDGTNAPEACSQGNRQPPTVLLGRG